MDDDAVAAAMADDDLVVELTRALDFSWLFVCLVLVVLMQAGFAAYEASQTHYPRLARTRASSVGIFAAKSAGTRSCWRSAYQPRT